jgi:uncharacterized membrane protein
MSKAELSASVIVAAFSSEAAAQAAFDQIKDAKKELGLRDAALVQRDGDKVHIKETKDMGGGKGAVIGGVLTGIATGGLSILGGALLGGLYAKGHDANLANKEMKALGAALPDGFAVLAVVDEMSTGAVTDMLKMAGATATTVSLDADTVARLTAVAGEAPAEAEAPAAE